MKYAKLITTIALTLCLAIGTVAQAASNITVQFENTPLFNEANVLPGDGVTRFIKVTNNTTAPNKVAVYAENFPNPTPSDDLARALDMKISKGGVDLWGGNSSSGAKTLFDFYQAGEIFLSDINAGQMQQYDFTLSISTDKGDLPVSPTTWQQKRTNFDIVIGFLGQYNPPCEGPNCPCVGPVCHSDPPCTGPNCGGGGGGGGGGGSGCEIWIIENPVTSVKAQNIQTKSADIIWATNCKGDSQVMYSPETGNHTFDTTKSHYGYTNESLKKTEYVFDHSIGLVNLTSCTKYYFRVVSGNPKIAVSREYAFTTPGCVEGTSTIETHDYRNYGEPDLIKESVPAGIVAGSSTCACSDKECDCKEEEPVKSLLSAFGINATACGTYDDIPWILAVLMLCLCLYEKNRKDMLRKKIKQIGYVLTENDRKFDGKLFFQALIFPLIILIILLLLQWICPDIIMLWWFWVIMITLLGVWTYWHYQRKKLQKIFKGLQEIKSTTYQI